MKRQFFLAAALALALGLGLSIGSGQSQAGVEDDPLTPDEITTSISPVMSYQGRLASGGAAVDGVVLMTTRLYEDESGGGAIWQEGPESVLVSRGLFTVILGDSVPLPVGSMDRSLWLEIEVTGTVLPRQKLTGSPYAFSLAPGSRVTGDLPGTVLRVENQNPGGIGIWTKNSSSDATLVLENFGTGHLLKGFGADGGEDELRIGNGGTIASKADSYIFVPGMQAQLQGGGISAVLDVLQSGRVVVNPDGTGFKGVMFAIPLPGVLYGQPVKVEEVTIYYTSSSPLTYIDQTDVYRQGNSSEGAYYTMASDSTNRSSTNYTSYSVPVTSSNVLSAEEGMVNVWLGLYFDLGDESLRIGGVRVRLGHHPLY